MSKCRVCEEDAAKIQDTPEEYDWLCHECGDAWSNSTAYAQRTDFDADSANYYRQLHDWLETKRRERANGGFGPTKLAAVTGEGT